MNKTKVDDMLIEMITPQIKEIEEKFGKGEGLTQSDIHTLLLKSQYNHINHLDEKLDEVTTDVASLKGDFKELRSDFKLLEERVNSKINNLENKFDTFKAEVREDIANVKIDIVNVKTDIANLKTDMEKTIKETMKWYIGGIGVVIVALKLLDVFVK